MLHSAPLKDPCASSTKEFYFTGSRFTFFLDHFSPRPLILFKASSDKSELMPVLSGRHRQIDLYGAVNKPTEGGSAEEEEEEEEEEEVTVSGWFELRSDKHLMVHSHDEASSGVLSAAGRADYSP